MPKISKRVLSLEASVEVNRKLQAIGMPPTDRVIMAVLDGFFYERQFPGFRQFVH